ncbi:hypothetical protein [Candidatus Harpocratesius sp.]
MKKKSFFLLFCLFCVCIPIQTKNGLGETPIDFYPEYYSFELIPPNSDIHSEIVGKAIVSNTPMASTTIGDIVQFSSRVEFEVVANLYTFYSTEDIYPDANEFYWGSNWLILKLSENFNSDPVTTYEFSSTYYTWDLEHSFDYDLSNLMEYYTDIAHNNLELFIDYLNDIDLTLFKSSPPRNSGGNGAIGDVKINHEFLFDSQTIDNDWFSLYPVSTTSSILETTITNWEAFEIAQYDDIYSQFEGYETYSVSITDVNDDNLDLSAINFGEVNTNMVQGTISENLGMETGEIFSETVQQGRYNVEQGIVYGSQFEIELIPDITVQRQPLSVTRQTIAIDTDTGIFGTSPAGIVASLCSPAVKEILGSRIVSWHVQNYALQIHFKVVAEIRSDVQLVYHEGYADHPIPLAQLSDYYWNIMLYGDRDIEVYEDTSDFNWQLILTILILLILGFGVLVALFVFIRLAPFFFRRR